MLDLGRGKWLVRVIRETEKLSYQRNELSEKRETEGAKIEIPLNVLATMIRQTADSRPTNGQQSDRIFGELFFTIKSYIKQYLLLLPKKQISCNYKYYSYN